MDGTKIQWTDALSVRFWRNVTKTESQGCWEWKAGRFADGLRYGQFRVGKVKWKAHRFAFVDSVGPIPEGLRVLHQCDNAICCRPNHLFLGTDKDNAEDRERKGRGNRAAPPALLGELNGAVKLALEDVKAIRALKESGQVTQRAIATMFQISESQVGNIVRGQAWRQA